MIQCFLKEVTQYAPAIISIIYIKKCDSSYAMNEEKYDHNLMLVNPPKTYYIIDQSISRIKNKTKQEFHFHPEEIIKFKLIISHSWNWIYDLKRHINNELKWVNLCKIIIIKLQHFKIQSCIK